MWYSDLALVFLTALAGFQDWRRREVSNFLTIPLYLAGLAGMLWRLLIRREELSLVLLVVLAALTWAGLQGWMGGADYKVLVGLFGLWPLGGLAALLGTGLWGGLVWLASGNRRASFPGIPAMALAAALTFLAEVSIMLLKLT